MKGDVKRMTITSNLSGETNESKKRILGLVSTESKEQITKPERLAEMPLGANMESPDIPESSVEWIRAQSGGRAHWKIRST